MSHKRYQYKLVEAADQTEFETLIKEAGSQQWSAVGYGVLPDGRRSALMERKTKVHTHRHKDHRQHQQHDDRQQERADQRPADRVIAHEE